MASLDHLFEALLPADDESPRCSDFAQTIGLQPAGTAIRADRVMLVETSLPWPKPVFDHPTLREIKNVINASPTTRLLASVPDDERLHTTATEVLVFDRLADGTVRHHRYMASDPNELLDVATSLVDGDESACKPLCLYDDLLTAPVMLVCTQGSHDVCCGAEGARFAAAAAERFVDLPIYRVSHTGGHRFAPTAMTLPDGRMWANLDLDVLGEVLDGDFPRDHCRGWWGAETGFAQVAELAVRAEKGRAVDTQLRTVTVTLPEDSDPMTRCTIATSDDRWEAVISVSRQLPTISCRAPGGAPFKLANEYIVESLTRLES